MFANLTLGLTVKQQAPYKVLENLLPTEKSLVILKYFLRFLHASPPCWLRLKSQMPGRNDHSARESSLIQFAAVD